MTAPTPVRPAMRSLETMPAIAHQVLARRPDDRVVLLLAREQLLGGVGALAPEIVGVEELDRVAIAVDLEPHAAIRDGA